MERIIFIIILSVLTSCIVRISGQNNSEPETRREIDHIGKSLDLGLLQEFYKTPPATLSSSHPNIYLIMIDTLRADKLKSNAPYISRLIRNGDYFSAKRSISAATSTAHALFSVFWGMFPNIRYSIINSDIVKENPEKYLRGSPFLYLLRQHKYDLNTYAYQDLEFCKDKKGNPYPLFQTDQLIHLQVLYSYKSYDFLNHCQRYKQTMSSSDNWGLLDDNTVGNFIKSVHYQRQSKTPRFRILRLQAVHHPYGWISKRLMNEEYKKQFPFEWEEPSKTTWQIGEKDQTDWVNVLNSYDNSVRSADYQVWRVIRELEAIGDYEKSIVIIMGDHGHALFDIPEPANVNGHGFLPFIPLTSVPLLIKLPKGHAKTLPKDLRIASSADLFPTILDAIDIPFETATKDLPIIGDNLFKKRSKCEVSFKSEYDFARNGSVPTRLSSFAVDNDTHRLIFVGSAGATKKTGLRLKYKIDIASEKSMDLPAIEELPTIMKAEYSDCIKKIWGSEEQFLSDTEFN